MSFAVLLIISLWVFHAVLLEFFYKQIKTQSLKSTASAIAATVETSESTDMELVKVTANDLAIKNEVSITVIATSDELFFREFSVLSDQGNMLDTMTPYAMLEIYNEALDNGGETLQHYQRGAYSVVSKNNPSERPKRIEDGEFNQWENDGHDEFFPKHSFKQGAPSFFKLGITQELLLAKVVTSADGNEYLLIFDSVITPMHSTVKTLKSQLIFQSVLILAIAAIIAQLLSDKISKPITDINRSAKKLAAGNYETDFSGDGYLEVAQLSETLNFTAKELKEADNVKRELIANTSHDMRTPLTMIIGYAEVMRDLPGENTPENVQVIIDEATRLTNLVNDMLDLSNLQSGAASLDMSEFNITALTKEIVDRMRKLNEKDGFVFEFEPAKEILVNADAIKITQVIYNFLINSVNYSEESRRVVVCQKTVSGKVRFEFTDFGKGIPKEKLPSIWDRYYKIDSTHKRAQSGSGIGLSIVKSVLELHKANYGVISNVNSGSTFWFELPISKIVK